MYKIQANQSGTRSIEVSDLHLETIDKYQLLRNLVDSNGIIDEEVLEKLKLILKFMSIHSVSKNIVITTTTTTT